MAGGGDDEGEASGNPYIYREGGREIERAREVYLHMHRERKCGRGRDDRKARQTWNV